MAWLALLTGYLILTNLEEKHLFEVYGEKYEEYSRRTAFIIPYLNLNVPKWLSPREPYRYLILISMWLPLTVAMMIGMRGLVFALRSVFAHGLNLG